MLTIGSKARLMGGAAAIGGIAFAFSAMADHPGQVLPDFTIPSAIDPAVVADIQFADYVHVKHGIGMAGALARSSEFGHENYRGGELSGEYMRSMGQTWVDMVWDITETFWDFDGTIAVGLEMTEAGLVPVGGMRLQDYSNAAYAYHLHHRGPRWRGEGHEDITDYITRDGSVLAYFTSIGRHVLDHHYTDGHIVNAHMENGDHDHANGAMLDYDTDSMAFGLSAVHSLIYAWVRWAAPEGEDDMGVVPEEQLEGWLGYSIDDIVEISRDIGVALDGHWIEEVGAYDFGDGTRYELPTLGALITGHKGLYEMLAAFGEDEDRELAVTLAERAATMLEPIVLGDAVTRDWGLPARLEYTAQGVQAASGVVSVADQWEFITRVTGGFGFTREREGENSGMLIRENAPEIFAGMGVFTDRLLMGAMEYQLDDQGLAVTELDYFTGEVTNPLYTPAALGSFLTGTGNVYRSHEAVARARDWDSVDEETLERSVAFHDMFVRNAEFLRSAFLVQRTW